MPPTIELTRQTHERLREIGGSLFSDAEVVERLLDYYSQSVGEDLAPREERKKRVPSPSYRTVINSPDINNRAPRQRGITVDVEGTRIAADSVRDLYEQFLRWAVESGRIKALRAFIPFETSGDRFLITDRKVPHPKGGDFVVPIEYAGLRMECHKDYKNAFNHLEKFLGKAGIPIKYLG